MSESFHTILIADDEPLVLKIASAVLEAAGFNVLVAKDGQEELTICRQHEGRIHLALLDYYMPGLNGGRTGEAVNDGVSESADSRDDGVHGRSSSPTW